MADQWSPMAVRDAILAASQMLQSWVSVALVGRCDRGRIHRSSYRQGHREEASGCLICLGGITHESEHEAKALRRLVAGRAGKRAVRRVRFERPYGAAGRCLLAYSVFHHHPAYHRTGKRHGGASPLPDALRMDGGLLGAALCAAQRVHLSLPPCDVPCAGQYPRPAAGQASDAAAGTVLDRSSGSYKNIIVERVDSIENHPCPPAAGDDHQHRGALAVLVLLFIEDWRMGLSMFIVLPLGILCFMSMFSGYNEKFQRTVTATKTLNDTAVEYISGH